VIGNQQSQSQQQSQQQRLSPQQLQYVHLLQLGSDDLEHRIEQELEENPLLEWVGEQAMASDADAGDGGDTYEALQDTLGTLDRAYDGLADNYDKTSTNHPGFDQPITYVDSIIEHLEKQIALLDLDEKQLKIADQILGSLEDDGYFRRGVTNIANSVAYQLGVSIQEQEVEQVLHEIQRLDPPGVAARDLRECLLIQLELASPNTRGRSTALAILRDEWDVFEKKHYERLQSKLHINKQTLLEAIHCIQSLDPKPGAFATSSSPSVAVRPDLSVVRKEQIQAGDADLIVDELAIILHRKNKPRLMISRHYQSLLEQIKQSGTSKKELDEAAGFLKPKLESARWFIDAIERRGETILLLARWIVYKQKAFFLQGMPLKPLLMREMADLTGLDVSTISRSVRGKYMQCAYGVYELRYFFNEGINTGDGEEVSTLEIQGIVERIIAEEDKSNPYTDEELVAQLKARGHTLARRTLAKYREALHIPVARLRRVISDR
jgi:RNA polymerase sigma-54 factor